jgi:phytoene dehydrogenase-like protein
MAQFGRLMVHMGMAVKPILNMVPPDPSSLAPSDLKGLLALAKHFRSLGSGKFHALYKLMTMSSADYLDEWFEFDTLKATKSASGIIGTFLGPRSPGTAYVLLHHYMGEIDGAFRAWGFQKGGTGAISNAIASAARAFGAEIRTEAPVSKVLTSGSHVSGVVLGNGDELRAPLVISGLDPRRTFTQLLDPTTLPGDLVDGVRKYKFRGSSGKVNLALKALPEFTCFRNDRDLALRAARGGFSISPTVEYLEHGTTTRSTTVLASAVHGHRDSVHDRSRHGAAGAARDEHLRAVRALRRDRRLGRRQARRIRQHRDQDAVVLCAKSRVDHRRQAGHHTGGHRADHRAERRTDIFQGRARAAPAVLPRPVPKWAKCRTPVRGFCSAARERIPAAVSWARAAASPRWKS